VAKPDPSQPSIADLSRYGSVNTVALYLGILLFTIGAFGDVSLSNKKLMLGAILICFSFSWRYLTRIPSRVSNPDDRPWTHMNWGSAISFLLFAATTVVLILASIRGHFPRFPLSLHCW
jgi:hypothetical protein